MHCLISPAEKVRQYLTGSMKMSKLIVNMLPDILTNYWGNTVTNAIEKHVRKGTILPVQQCTTSIWYIRCKENVEA